MNALAPSRPLQQNKTEFHNEKNGKIIDSSLGGIAKKKNLSQCMEMIMKLGQDARSIREVLARAEIIQKK